MSEERCRDKRGILKKAQCALERFSEFSHKQSGEHKVAWAVFFITVISLSVTVGAVLYQGVVVNNPSGSVVTVSSQLNAGGVWKDQAGNTIAHGGTVSGTITGTISGQCYGVESGVLTVNYMGSTRTPSVTIPYYISEVSYQVFSGTSTTYPSGSPVVTLAATPSHSDYGTKMQAWLTPATSSDLTSGFKSWIAKLYQGYLKTGYVDEPNISPGLPDYSSETWVANLDTTTVANGVYTIWMKLTWKWVTTAVIGTGSVSYPNIVSPSPGSMASPPSGVTVSGNSVFLSSLLLGQAVGPTLTVAISANTTKVDSAPAMIAFTSDISGAVGPVTYAWNFGDGANSTEANPTHTFVNNGTFTVVLRATDSSGQYGTASLKIQVGPVADNTLYFAVAAMALVAVAVVVIKKRG